MDTSQKSKGAQLKNEFEKFFQFLGVKSSGNIINDTYSIATHDNETLKHNFMKCFFENYDKNQNGLIDNSEVLDLMRDISVAVGAHLSSNEEEKKLISDEEVQETLKIIGVKDLKDIFSEKKGPQIDFKTFESLVDHLKLLDLKSPHPKRSVNIMDTLSSFSSKSQTSSANDSSTVGKYYSKKISKDFTPILHLFNIQPSGNMYEDLLLLRDALSSNDSELEKVMMRNMLQYFFGHYDHNNDGYIDAVDIRHLLNDMKDVLSVFGEPSTDDENHEQQVQKYLKKFDADGNGKVDFHDFVNFFEKSGGISENK